jgi:hypothetical protein
MTTIVEKTSDGIIYRAAKTYPVPDLDVLTLLFGKFLGTFRPMGRTMNSVRVLRTILTVCRLRTFSSKGRHANSHFSCGPKSRANHIPSARAHPRDFRSSPQAFWHRRPRSRKRYLLRHRHRPLPASCAVLRNHWRGWCLLRCVCGKHSKRAQQTTSRR